MNGHGLRYLACALFALTAGCSSSESTSASSSDNALTSDVADKSCRIVLRYAAQSGINGGEVYVAPSSHTSWVRYRAVADVDSRLIAAGGVVSLRYRAVFSGPAVGGTFPQKWVDVKAVNPIDNPGDPALKDPSAGLFGLGGKIVPKGYTRVAFVTTTDTLEAGDDVAPTIEMIPFVDASGSTLWDHNRVADPLGTYKLDNGDLWRVWDDFGVCPAPS